MVVTNKLYNLKVEGLKPPSAFFMQKWKSVKGFEDSYEVSNDGFVRSLSRSVKYKHGGKDRVWPGKILNHYLARNGYCDITLKRANKNHHFALHRLVGIAFIPNPLNLPQINHKDNNKQNNHMDNLEWCDQHGNMRHAFDNNHHSGQGATHYKSRRILNLATKSYYNTLDEAAAAIGMPKQYIWRRLSGEVKNNINLVYA